MDKQNDAVMTNRERGIALLIVLFALLLLSVIGLGMMYSTNMETNINYNYRDKQEALYAALAGLQEARTRIKYPYDITPPFLLPATGQANIIYIVSDASTVRPWDPNNRYFDTELCHENVLGLTPETPGVPCTTTASGTDWYQVKDDSQSASAPWNLPNPLDWKWTRIQLKANNNTPIAVNGDTTSADQACWNGVNQMSTPTGYTTGCKPNGGVNYLTVVTQGTGYTSAPDVIFSGGGGGSGAAATAIMAPETTGSISAITVTDGGAGYTSPPPITFSSGAATATAVLATTGAVDVTGGSVTSVTVDNGGSGYKTPPTVTFSGGTGSGATATAVLSSTGTVETIGYLSGLTLTNAGAGYTTPPTVNINGGGGSGATATATLSTAGRVNSIEMSSAGTQCYSQASDVVIGITGGGGSGAAATGVLETTRGCIYSTTVTSTPQCASKLDAMNGYSPIDQKSGLGLTASPSSGFSGTLYVSPANDKTPTGISIQNPGYDTTAFSSPTLISNLRLSSGTWTDCGNISVTLTTGYRLASINVTNNGSGYTSDPTVTISGGIGTSDPTATVTRGFPINQLTITDPGSGYSGIPTVTFSGGGGSGATATANVQTTNTVTYSVASINVTSGGIGYTDPPSVTLSGGAGSGAAATANIATTTVTTYPIASITVNSGGAGYSATTPPTITISGGGGAGATAVPTITTTATGTFFVDHFDVTAAGSGYKTNPTVTLSNGGGTGASATSQIAGGTKFGKVWLLTSLAETSTHARSMVQMEVASPVLGLASGGALTLDGPDPAIDAMPNSVNFTIKGNDANNCHDADSEPDHPAIDGFDDPNAEPPTASVEIIKDSLPRPDHYTGAGGIPSVQNGFGSMGETMSTPEGMDSGMAQIYNDPQTVKYDSSNVNTFTPSTTTTRSITYVDGDLTLNGTGHGYGILVVTGTLVMDGNFSWTGLIYVVGDGHVEMNGGGNGQILGSIWVAKTWDSYMTKNLLPTMGQPTFNWNGGGVNSVQYDHCYVTDLLTRFDFSDLHSTRPLKVLSMRVLPY